VPSARPSQLRFYDTELTPSPQLERDNPDVSNILYLLARHVERQRIALRETARNISRTLQPSAFLFPMIGIRINAPSSVLN
jgi:hypothetical protein